MLDALLSGAADYGTAALPSLLTVWERTRGSANEVKAVGAVSNGAMTLYTINPNVKTLADFGEQDRIAVPTVRLSFNAMMLQMAAEQLWGDPHRLDHLTVALGHPDAGSRRCRPVMARRQSRHTSACSPSRNAA